MLFNTPQYFAFLIVVLILFYYGPRDLRKTILLAASYFFYGYWNARFLALLIGLTAIDYSAAHWITRSSTPRSRKAALIVSLIANLGLLGFFKYYNFLAGNLAFLLHRPRNSFFLDIILPLGISFHTFQSMSYVIDVYRGRQEVIRNPLDYALFVAFFPQLVAGPIVRAHEFFGDLYNWRKPTSDHVLQGTLLILLGLVKKMAMADQFARFADAYFANPSGHPGMLTAWSGVVAFGIQVYFDFSGYTDIAIGSAKLFGFHFPANFQRPYLASSVTDFWRRWHISLSRWLRDYLYIPLGGNRHGRWKTYRNLFLTMLLGGLWHGASWNFVLWGGLQGIFLAVERMFRHKGTPASEKWTPLYPLQAVLTFAAINGSFALFRAQSMADSWYILRQMFTGEVGVILIPAWALTLAGVSLALAVIEEKRSWFDGLCRGPVWAYASACAVLLLAVELLGYTEEAVPFVYFQF